MTEQERREHFAFLNGVAADMKESRKEIIDLLEGIKAEIKTAARKHLDIALSITELTERKEHLKAEEALNYCVSLIDRHIKEYTE